MNESVPADIQKKTWFFQGIEMGHAISRFDSLSHFEGGYEAEVVQLHFGLKGDYKFHHKQLDKSFDLIGGHQNILYSPKFDMTVHNKTLEIETFGIRFPKHRFLQFTENSNDLLKRFNERVISGKPTILSDQWGPINTSMQLVIRQIVDSKFSGVLQNIFLLSKSLELLVLAAESCEITSSRTENYIKNKADKERLIAARDLINNNLHQPPTLTQVAQRVGLNEYKLKRGFQEMFNNTVFGYLTEQRLDLAMHCLQDTDQTVAEIAYDLGYSTPQHFHHQFKKKFNVTPNSVRNNP